MAKRNWTLEEWFDNENFKVFAPHFFADHNTELGISKKVKVDRLTIKAFREDFEEYTERNMNIHPYYPYKYRIALLADYLTKVLTLSDPERSLLLRIISDNDIRKIIVKNNQSTNEIISKIVLIVLSLDILRERPINTWQPLSKRESAVGIERHNVQSRSEYYELLNRMISLGKSISSMSQKEREIDDQEIQYFSSAAIELADRKNPYLSSLSKKFRQSNFNIVVYPKALHGLMVFMLGNIDWVKAQDHRKVKR